MDPIDPNPDPNPPPPPQNRRRSSNQRPLAPRPSPPVLPTLAPAPPRSQSHSISPFHNSPRLPHQPNPNIIPHYPPQAMDYGTTSASYFPSVDQPFTYPTDMHTLTHQNPFGSVSPVTIPIQFPGDLTYWLTVPQPYGNFDAFGFDPNSGNISGSGRSGSGGDEMMGMGGMEEVSDEAGERGTGEERPVMQKRKAQNRAAQRAFRERKERHVKQLEEKLTALEASQSTVLQENDRLKLELQKLSTENEILRTTSSPTRERAPPLPSSITELGPTSYTPRDFFGSLLAPHADKSPNCRVVRSESGERLVGAGAVWEMIVSDPLVVDGMVDLQELVERLKPLAQCDGNGPVFEESAVRKCIAESLKAGVERDELI